MVAIGIGMIAPTAGGSQSLGLIFWLPKLEGNRERDLKKQTLLRELGWNVMIIWECMIRDESALRENIRSFLENTR